MRQVALTLLAVHLMVTACPAWSQPANEAAAAARVLLDEDRAVALGHAALRSYAVERWEEALQGFEEAERAAHSPVFVLYMARCRRQLTQLLRARELYESVVTTPLEPEAPTTWLRAVEDATRESSALAAEIPSIRVSVRAAEDEAVELDIDGVPIDASRLSAPIQLDPGLHRVEGKTSQRRVVATIELLPGQREVPVELDVTPVSQPPPRALARPIARQVPGARRALQSVPASSIPQGVRSNPPRGESNLGAPAIASFAVGTAGLVLGTVAGLIAWSRVDDLERACPDKVCPPSQSGTKQSARTYAHLSTGGFAVGVLGLGAGLFLTFNDSGEMTVGRSSLGSLARPQAGP